MIVATSLADEFSMTFGLIVIAASIALGVGLVLLRVPGPIAQPVPDRWHKKSTPVSGGFALLAGLLVSLALGAAAGHASASLAGVAAGASAALLVGLADDRRWITPRTKFAGQIAVAVCVAAAVQPDWLPTAAAIPLGSLVLVAAMNSFNFLDNIDGLAAGTAGIAGAALALMSMSTGGETLRVLGCAIAGSCLGFLPLNYRPRRPAALFMGDAGSHLLGLTVGAGALLASRTGADGVAAGVAVAAPLLILALPIFDTTLVIVVRLAEGRPVWKGGTDHVSHRLVYVGLGEHQAVGALLGLSAACAGVALAVAAADDELVTGAAVGIVIALLVALGSRLALVTEARLEPDRRVSENQALAAENGFLAANAQMSEDLRDAVVEVGTEAERELEPDRARAD
jgi:UDP-GlcNAc:undecaprenyl-phosphate/decaprenyl-phosphate GlcNAc-1-phosphate transferase